MSRRVLRAACIAALFVSAGPLPVTHTGALPGFPADPVAATTPHTRATAEAAARQAAAPRRSPA
ncbi:hypothetical protein ACS04_06020, partial [Streptomyces roseus]